MFDLFRHDNLCGDCGNGNGNGGNTRVITRVIAYSEWGKSGVKRIGWDKRLLARDQGEMFRFSCRFKLYSDKNKEMSEPLYRPKIAKERVILCKLKRMYALGYGMACGACKLVFRRTRNDKHRYVRDRAMGK